MVNPRLKLASVLAWRTIPRLLTRYPRKTLDLAPKHHAELIAQKANKASHAVAPLRKSRAKRMLAGLWLGLMSLFFVVVGSVLAVGLTCWLRPVATDRQRAIRAEQHSRERRELMLTFSPGERIWYFGSMAAMLAVLFWTLV